MKCPYCQAQIRNSLAFCTNCGAALSGTIRQGTPAQAGAVAAPQPGAEAGRPAQGAPERALFLNFNEKPTNILRVMDQAKRQQGEFVTSFRQRLRLLLLLLPAGLPFVFLDWVLGNGLVAFSLVAYVLWGAALVGWMVLRREAEVRRQEKPRPPGAVVFQRAFTAIVLFVMAAGCALSVGAFPFLARNVPLVAGLVMAIVALVGLMRLRTRRPQGEAYGARFDAVHTIFETLKDDLAPKRTLLGWLDLSGAQQPSKVVREVTSSSGMPIKYYRDEWLRLKMPLYDGNLLRVSAVERVKARLGRWKRSRSGKSKWKPGGAPQARNEVRVVVALNPEGYRIVPVEDGSVGKFVVETRQNDGRRLELAASSQAGIDGWDVLRLLRFAYDHVKPLDVPAAQGQ